MSNDSGTKIPENSLVCAEFLTWARRSVSSFRHHSRTSDTRTRRYDLRAQTPGPSEQPKERRTARSNHPLTSIAGPLPHRPVFGRLQAIAVTGCERSRTCAALLASSASSTTSLPMRPDTDDDTHPRSPEAQAGRAAECFLSRGLLHALGPEGQSFCVAETSSRNDVQGIVMLKQSIVATSLAALAATIPLRAEIVEQVLVKVNGEIITKTEFEARQVAGTPAIAPSWRRRALPASSGSARSRRSRRTSFSTRSMNCCSSSVAGVRLRAGRQQFAQYVEDVRKFQNLEVRPASRRR